MDDKTMDDKTENRTRSGDAVSDTIGFLLIIGIMITMIGMIYAVSYPVLWDTQKVSYFDNVQQSFIVLGSNINRIMSDRTPSQSIEIQTLDANIEGGTSSTINVTWTNSTNSTDDFDCWDFPNCTAFNLLTIEHSRGGRTIAYEGGGVWEKYVGGGVATHLKPRIGKGSTITIPVASGSSSSAGGGGMIRISVRSPGTPTVIEENDVKNVLVNVTSDYCLGWKNYFEVDLGASTSGDCAGNSVVANLGDCSSLFIILNYISADITAG